MGSTGVTVVLLSCVVLSMVAVGFAASEKPLIISNTALEASTPEASSSYMVAAGSASSDKPLIISNAALEAGPPEASPSSARKLGAFPMDAGMCPLRLDHMKLMGNVQGSCMGQATPHRRCCTAFKAFVCPYGATMNDVDNGCAARMMARIHQLCQVPKGYFVMCGDSSEGITC